MPQPKIARKETIEKGKPMPCICKICQSIKALSKSERDKEKPENNSCFEKRPYFYDYAPFTNSRRKVVLTCQNFSHVRSFMAW
jgi:hypothetical protein